MRLGVFIVLLFWVGKVLSQDNKTVLWSLSIEPQKVFIYAHDEKLERYKGSGGFAVSLAINRLRLDDIAKAYAGIRYNSGFGFQFVSFDSASLGKAVNLSYFMEPLLIDKPGFQWRMKFAGGVNFASNPYDKTNNPTNRAYGLPINGYLGLGTSFYAKLGERTWVFANATYSHFSNGNTQNPNLGLNYPHLGLGLDYALKQTTKPIGKTLFYKERWRYDIGIFGGTKIFPFYPEERFYAYGLNGQVSYRRNNLHGWTLAAEGFKDNTIKIYLDSNINVVDKDKSNWLGGILVGHEFLFNRCIFSQQLGYYVFNQIPGYVDSIYHRWGFNYKLHKNLMLGLNLNANLQKAFLLDFRIVASLYQ